MNLNGPEESRIKGKLYNEFYERNKDLYKTNREEFMRLQWTYVSQEFTKIKYRGEEAKND